jgi:hypothetical protein
MRQGREKVQDLCSLFEEQERGIIADDLDPFKADSFGDASDAEINEHETLDGFSIERVNFEEVEA